MSFLLMFISILPSSWSASIAALLEYQKILIVLQVTLQELKLNKSLLGMGYCTALPRLIYHAQFSQDQLQNRFLEMCGKSSILYSQEDCCESAGRKRQISFDCWAWLMLHCTITFHRRRGANRNSMQTQNQIVHLVPI